MGYGLWENPTHIRNHYDGWRVIYQEKLWLSLKIIQYPSMQ
jgi:hypothetical protein